MAAHTHETVDLPVDLILRDGSRAFTAVVKGITPVAAEDLATKGYADALPGLSGDATKLQGRDVLDDDPADGDVLTWSAADSEWQPQAPAGGAGADGSGYYEIPARDWLSPAMPAGDHALAITSSPTQGNRRVLEGIRNFSPATAEAAVTQAEVTVPRTFVPGDTLRLRVRLTCTAMALTYTRVALSLKRVDASGAAVGSSLVSTSAIAFGGWTVGESVVGDAVVDGAPWRDYEFTVTTTDLGPSECLTLLLRCEYDDVGSGSAIPGTFRMSHAAMVVGVTTWPVGTLSLVGSAKVG